MLKIIQYIISKIQTMNIDYSYSRFFPSRVGRFVFIITYGRSGSTFLQAILNTCENVDIRGENSNALFGLYKSYKSALLTRNRFGQKRNFQNHPWYGADLIDPDKYARRLVDVFISEIMKPRKGIEICGFKEIRYFENIGDFEEYINFVTTYFPGCRILLNIRNVDAVANSGWWKNQDPENVKKKISHYRELLIDYAGRNRSIALLCEYEEYTSNIDLLRDAIGFVGGKINEERLVATFHERLQH